MNIGKNIRMHRREINITQAELGERSGVSKRNINKLEVEPYILLK